MLSLFSSLVMSGFEITTDGPWTIVCCSGELDRFNLPQFQTGIARILTQQRVIFDLTDLVFLDCGILAAIVDCRDRANGDRSVVMCRPGGQPSRLLALTHQVQHFNGAIGTA